MADDLTTKNKAQALVPLDERKREILKAVISDYVMTAEPVGSKNLLKRHKLNYSSATVRNEMAELEEMGYLEKPHTSAGRIPSDIGYRLYVDELIEPKEMSLQEQQLIKAEFNKAFDNFDHLLSQAADFLSRQTGYTSILLTPEANESYVKHLRMLQTEPGQIMIIVVLQAGLMHNRLVRVNDLFTKEQLRSIAEAIENSVSKTPLAKIDLLTIEQVKSEVEIPATLLEQLIYEAWLAIKQADNPQACVKGMPNLLRYPEFHDPLKAEKVLGALSNVHSLCGMLPVDLTQLQDEQQNMAYYSIRIGQELLDEDFADCSLVSSVYKLHGQQIGQINVIGPRRMNYEKVLSRVHFVSQTLNELLNEDKGKCQDKSKFRTKSRLEDKNNLEDKQ